MADMVEDENHLNEMLMFTLLPYVSKVLGKNPYNCSKRLQRYAGEALGPVKALCPSVGKCQGQEAGVGGLGSRGRGRV